ncbi:MAG: hypothetical protein NZZ41_00240 [Candidatus Dojkabacteria bacterium]|nr:hypothetical protein [Candidatus Dojkabacteria bacterium]
MNLLGYKNFFHIVINGGLGDSIMSLPVLKWGIENIFEENFRVSCPPQYDFLIRDWISEKYIHPFEELVSWAPWVSIKKIFPNEYFVPRTNLSIFSSLSFFGKIIEEKYLSLWKWKNKVLSDKIKQKTLNINLENSVVIPVSYRSHSKKWNSDVLKKFINFLFELGHSVILVGGEKSQDHKNINEKFSSKKVIPEIKNENLISFVGEITIEETLSIMQKCKYIVGVTGGLIQLSGLTDKKILCICTYTNIFHSLFWRNGIFGDDVWVVLPEGCKSCVNDLLVYGYDYNDCLKNLNYECTNINIETLKQAFLDMTNDKKCQKISEFRETLKYNYDF